MEIVQARAPYVDFEERPEHDAEASIKAGHPVYKSVHYALITPAGSKDVVEREVSSWFSMLKTQVDEGRFPSTWRDVYRKAYEEWKSTGETPVDGTPLVEFPLLTKAQIKTLQGVKLMSVEQLAEANEEAIQRMGMGGRVLKDKAAAWLRARGDSSNKMAEENVDLKMKLETSNSQLESAQQQIDVMRMQLAALQNLQAQAKAPEATSTGITSSDLLSEDKKDEPTGQSNLPAGFKKL